MNTLREIVLEKGCDPFDWNAGERHDAATEVYQSDEKSKVPTWLMDAFSDAMLRDKERKALLERMLFPGVARHAAIGLLVERWLVEFTLDHLQRTAEEYETTWLAQREAS